MAAIGAVALTGLAGCGGGGGGGGGGAIGTTSRQLAEWVGLWSDDAARGVRRPPMAFDIPAPPVVTLVPAATQIADDVHRSAAPLAALRARAWEETAQDAAAHTQAALCEWFSWYLQDPFNRIVPAGDEFAALLVLGALKVKLATPPEKEIRDAAELFRNAVERGQDSAEDVRNAAMAGACSVPTGS